MGLRGPLHLLVPVAVLLVIPSGFGQDCPLGTTAYYPLDEDSSGSYADAIDQNDATCGATCPTPVIGRASGAQEFERANGDHLDAVDTGAFDFAAADSFTIELWLNKGTACSGDGPATVNEVAIARADGNLQWWVGVFCRNATDEGKVRFILQSAASENAGLFSTSRVDDGMWHHVVAVRDGVLGQNRLYIDGDLEGSVNKTYVGSFSGTAALNIGYQNLPGSSGSDYHLDGALDEVAIYARALTAGEIEAHYDAGQLGLGPCACTSGAQCDDGVVCTADACDGATNTCIHTPIDDVCDDGLFCNGTETCGAEGCVAGSSPCKGQSCDEAGDVCVPCLIDADCDDGLFCNGAEICIDEECIAGSTPCDDDVACTVDTCDDVSDMCANTPDNSLCDDGNPCTDDLCDIELNACINLDNTAACDDGDVCNGADQCAGGTCVFGADPVVCDDGLFCTGVETCDAVAGCVAGPAPCVGQVCDESTDTCVQCLVDADCIRRGTVCDTTSGSCVECLEAAHCDDGAFCNGAESCARGVCQTGSARCDDGVACTLDTCDEDSATCTHTADATLCDDATFCNGVESCDAVAGCVSGVDPCPGGLCDEATDVCGECILDADCPDANGCTTESCVDNVCVSTPNSKACDDGDACTTDEACVDGACVGGVPIDCDDGDPCTVDTCLAGVCSHPPVDCGPRQVCDPATGDCIASGSARVFMALDGSAEEAPGTGPTAITLAPGTSTTVHVWIEDDGSATSLNGHQLLLPQAAGGGSVGSLTYVDSPPLDSGLGASAFIDTTRADWAFAGDDQSPAYIENAAAGRVGLLYTAQLGTAFDIQHLGPRYLGEFDLAASADACGTFTLPFIGTGDAPPLTTLFAPFGAQYPVAELQPLWIHMAPPLNDNCTDATALVGEVDILADSRCATQDGVAHACGNLDADVWYAYTPTCTGDLTVSTAGCGFDTALAVYAADVACPPQDADLIACVDNAADCDELTTFVVADQPVLIRVGNAAGTGGVTPLRVTCVDVCQDAASCADGDGDGIRDDNCVWSACHDGICAGVDVPFADLGGSFGACEPDGVVDLSDRFHALLCLADLNTAGGPGYPCEVVNVDAGGPFGSCCPDGECDLNDAFHAINTLQGLSDCSCPDACPGGPAPEPPTDAAIHHTRLRVVARQSTVAAQGTVLVDVFLEDALPNLRGYQLHMQTSGGQRGQLKLQGTAVDGLPAGALSGLPDRFDAANVARQLVAVGVDGGGAATPAMSYLATFAYHVPRDAAGTFVIDLAIDVLSGGRSFLIAYPAVPIAIDAVTPARITVHRDRPSR